MTPFPRSTIPCQRRSAYFELPREAERWYERRDQTHGGSIALTSPSFFCWKRTLGSQNRFSSSEHVYLGGAIRMSGLQSALTQPVEDGL